MQTDDSRRRDLGKCAAPHYYLLSLAYLSDTLWHQSKQAFVLSVWFSNSRKGHTLGKASISKTFNHCAIRDGRLGLTRAPFACG
jgi:hypothetical protein